MKQLFGVQKVIGTFVKQVPWCEVDGHQIHPVIPRASLVCINRTLGDDVDELGVKGQIPSGSI